MDTTTHLNLGKSRCKTTTVEVVINTYDGTTNGSYTGTYMLFATDEQGNTTLTPVRVTLTDVADNPEYARLRTINAALAHLSQRIRGNATYVLRLVQTSKNIDGWIGRGWKRNSEPIIEMLNQTDELLKVFPVRDCVKSTRAAVELRFGNSIN